MNVIMHDMLRYIMHQRDMGFISCVFCLKASDLLQGIILIYILIVMKGRKKGTVLMHDMNERVTSLGIESNCILVY